VVALVDQPADDFGLFETLAETGKVSWRAMTT
jgi:hypothetical protein